MNPKIDLNHFRMATTRIGNWLTKSSHWNPVFTIRYSVRYGLKFRYNWSESVDAPARTTFVLPLTPTEPAHNRRPRISPASLLRNGETNFGLYHPRPSVRNPRDKDRPFNSCRLWQCVFHCRPQIDARQEDERTACVYIYLTLLCTCTNSGRFWWISVSLPFLFQQPLPLCLASASLPVNKPVVRRLVLKHREQRWSLHLPSVLLHLGTRGILIKN